MDYRYYSQVRKEHSKYKDLVDTSKYKEKIEFLTSHPMIAKMILHRGDAMYDPMQWVNCHGSAAFLMGARVDIMKSNGDYTYGDKIPPHISDDSMENFLASLKRLETPQRDCLIGFYGHSHPAGHSRHRYGLKHTGVFLGHHDGKPILFNQLGNGDRFAFCSLDDLKNKNDGKDERIFFNLN
ncbi:MAG TPA: hypothetical protein VKE88_00650 [Candidatus Nanoarchaeia archaeon]|nr:hypothetical protein [Candidatus Nanoarchaeia archaeon]